MPFIHLYSNSFRFQLNLDPIQISKEKTSAILIILSVSNIEVKYMLY